MLSSSRHRKTRSVQQSSENNNITDATSPVQTNQLIGGPIGAVEWSKSTSRACSRLVPSLRPIFNRGENFNGVASDGYGLLLSNDSAFIFPYTTTSSTPPILTFPLPQGEDYLLGGLIAGPTDEPGLLVVMPTTGRIGFWPALHSALAPSAGIESRIVLAGGEKITHVCNTGAAGVVLSTSSGRLIHVSLRDVAGKPIVLLTNMSGSAGWLGALRNITSRREIVSIKAGAAHSREERQVHVVTRTGGLTIWEVARGGNHRNIFDTELSAALQSEEIAFVIDVVAYPIDTNSVLILGQTNQGMTKLFGIRFDAQQQPHIACRFSLPALNEPRIQLPNPGHVAFVHTRSSVHLITIADKNIECIRFKEEVEIVAIGIEDQLKSKRNPGLVLLTKGAGVMRIEAFQIPDVRPDSTKTKLEQAVFFGEMESNPIHFTPAPGSADIQARELSLEILSGTCPFVQTSISLGEVLKHRVRALQNLVSYISHNVKPITLQLMREHVEMAVAGEALWTSVDARVEGSSIISQLLPASSRTPGLEVGSDPVRSFFLYRLTQIPQLVPNSHRACVEAAAVLDSQPLAKIVMEANEIMLAVVISATRYRAEHSEYGIGGDLWTSSKDILQSTTIQFNVTCRLIAGLKHGEGNELRDQLVGLASANCRLYEDFLGMTQADTNDHKIHSTRYRDLRPTWIKSLVECGRQDKAFDIGETFKDYQTLIEICHEQGEKANDEDTIGSVVRRLEWYLHTFGYDFSAVLWEYYIANRQFWNLLHEFPNHRHYLTAFFANGRYPNISWINDVTIKDFDKAGSTLLRIPEKSIEKRKIQLSIARLALLVNNDTIPSEVEQRIRANQAMDALLSEIREMSKDAVDLMAAAEIASAVLIPVRHANSDRKSLLHRHISKLVAGEALSLGESIDYLTTKKNPDFSLALRLLSYSDSGEAVNSFYEALIWRRCLVSDDWPEVTDTRGRSDFTVEQSTAQTNLFRTIRDCLTHDPVLHILSPTAARYETSKVTPFEGLSATELQNLKQEYQSESDLLQRYIKTANLSHWHAGVLQIAQESLLEIEDDGFVRVEHDQVEGLDVEDEDMVMEE